MKYDYKLLYLNFVYVQDSYAGDGGFREFKKKMYSW